jgi:Uma2 family endonuclease
LANYTRYYTSKSVVVTGFVPIEVLSRKTEAFDRGDKFADYKTLETLEEYILVNQYQMTVERFQRNAEGFWVPFAYRKKDNVSFASVNFHNAIANTPS